MMEDGIMIHLRNLEQLKIYNLLLQWVMEDLKFLEGLSDILIAWFSVKIMKKRSCTLQKDY